MLRDASPPRNRLAPRLSTGLRNWVRCLSSFGYRRQSSSASVPKPGAANRVKSEFLAAMSHELRTPLNAIGGYAQLMQLGLSGPVTDAQLQQLDRVQQSQQHLLRVINDILNFSRIEAGHVTYDIEPFAVRDALLAVGTMIEPLAAAVGIHMEIRNCPTEVIANGDRAKFEQILINLLSNAVKFTKAGGRIEVSCGALETSIWISVQDTGVGIPAEHSETIFAPFAQVGRSLASPKEGAGLGLSISRDLARAMHGDLTVESREGLGSTFTLTLPRANDFAEDRDRTSPRG